MAYTLIFRAGARREFLDLPRHVRREMRPALAALAKHPRKPRLPRGASVEEMVWGPWEGYWRLRVGEYRAIYAIDDREEKVRIGRVRHRSEAYEGAPDGF